MTNEEALRCADALERRGYASLTMQTRLTDREIAAHIRRLVAENEALRADAERYRWLRERAWFQSEFDGRYGDCGETLGEMDAAIDAARGKV